MGISAQTSDQIGARLGAALKPRPDYLIVLAGVNDVYRGQPASHVTANLEKMYAKAAAKGVRVVACSILPYRGLHGREALAETNLWIHRHALERGYLFCDTHAAAENPSEPGTLLGSPDGLHPDPRTARRVGAAVTGCIEKDISTYYKKT